MIVRNEGAILGRCLESVQSLISYWVICDTGSTDNTCDVIRDRLSRIPGELHHDKWVDFGHNRTLGMSRARGKGDYHLLLDADMVLSQRGPLPTLESDAYFIRFAGLCDYSVARLVSDRHHWRYIGVTHEYIHSETATTARLLRELEVVHFEDGNSRTEKYPRDIALLRSALVNEPDNPRYVYYLAQSYRDSGDLQSALEWYTRRSNMGGWAEERWHALYQAAKLLAATGRPSAEVIETLLCAYDLRPSRLEPVYHLAKHFRETQRNSLALHFARLAREVPYPDDLLFVERDVYDYLLPMEYALACHALGKLNEARQSFDYLLNLPHFPDSCRGLIKEKRGAADL
jgi:glycosyltransferase involved in cell wall biosynthesis